MDSHSRAGAWTPISFSSFSPRWSLLHSPNKHNPSRRSLHRVTTTSMEMLPGSRRTIFVSACVWLLLSLLPSLSPASVVSATHGVFNVKCKYQERTLSALKAHDYRRQLSLLAGVDLPLGGSGRPDAVGSVRCF